MNDTSKIQEKKAALEEELRRTEKQIYDLEGEYLEVISHSFVFNRVFS